MPTQLKNPDVLNRLRELATTSELMIARCNGDGYFPSSAFATRTLTHDRDPVLTTRRPRLYAGGCELKIEATSVLLASMIVLGASRLGRTQAPVVPGPLPVVSDPSRTAEGERHSEPSIPVVSLTFKTETALSGTPSTSAFVSPIACSADGVPFVDFPLPPDYMAHAIYSLSAKKAIKISAESIPDLYDIIPKGYFVGEAKVGILVHATKDPKRASYTVVIVPGTPGRPVYQGEHHDYIVEFGMDGTYKRTVELPRDLEVSRVAALADDNLVAVAYDSINRVARLLLLDSGGNVIRPLQIPSQMEGEAKLRKGQTGGELNRVKAASSLSWWLMVPSRHKLVLYVAHSNAPPLEIGAGGSTREVPIETPAGFLLDALVSSSDRWIVRFRNDNPADFEFDSNAKSKNFRLYEVDPGLGTLVRRIAVNDGSLLSIACEKDGVFTAFSDDGTKLVLKTADLAHP